jgi:hypothetical protein
MCTRRRNSKECVHTSAGKYEHTGLPPDFKAEVIGTFKDCLSRQVSKGVHIRRGGPGLLNSKSEWHQPVLWRVQSELTRD